MFVLPTPPDDPSEDVRRWRYALKQFAEALEDDGLFAKLMGRNGGQVLTGTADGNGYEDSVLADGEVGLELRGDADASNVASIVRIASQLEYCPRGPQRDIPMGTATTAVAAAATCGERFWGMLGDKCLAVMDNTANSDYFVDWCWVQVGHSFDYDDAGDADLKQCNACYLDFADPTHVICRRTDGTNRPWGIATWQSPVDGDVHLVRVGCVGRFDWTDITGSALLTPGTHYYATTDGALTATPNDCFVGTACHELILFVNCTAGSTPGEILRLPATAAKGDSLWFNGSNWVALAVGANGTVLTADSGESAGVKWV